jgi:trehalose synthase-fused probable maltokinase
VTASPSPVPSLRVRGALSDALTGAVLGALDEGALRQWLMARRWFAAKGREPRSVRIAEVVPLSWGGTWGGDAVALVEVVTGGEGAELTTQHYQLPLALRAPQEAEPSAAVLLRVESEGSADVAVVIDGTADEQFRRKLAVAFAAGGGARFGDASARWVVEPVESSGVALSAGADTRVMKGEQSNTSIVFGDQAILKLFRRLEPGINPDVEIGHFLTTRAHFPHTPGLLGTIGMRWAGGEPAVAGMLQRYLPGSRDAWEFVLERLAAHLRGVGDDMRGDAAELGRVTRELHEALASVSDDENFAPAPAGRRDVQEWADAASRSVEDALQLLEARLASLPDATRVQGARVLDGRKRLLDRIDQARGEVGDDAGLRIRHHGDYHLGQVLRRREGGFVIIDFEGEPSRSLQVRRGKNSPLRDVAGMLRSFSYAAAVGGVEAGADAAAANAAVWEHGMRSAFLTAYLTAGGSALLLPGGAGGAEALISLFELEKVSYELGYELNNRPDWVWIPLQGLEREMHDGNGG